MLKQSYLCTLLLLAAGCKDKCDPFVDPGKVEDPHWEVAEDEGLLPGLSDDEVHPTIAGYEIMESIILPALK